MTIDKHNINAKFRHASGKFWKAEVNDSSLILKDRGQNSSPVVAVYDVKNSDFRIKLWADVLDVPTLEVTLNNVDCSLDLVKRHSEYRLYQGNVTKAQLDSILFGELGVNSGDVLDYCIETKFTPQNKLHLNWLGDTFGFPAELKVDSIEITPPVTGGSSHYLILKTSLKKYDIDLSEFNSLRVNNVWTYVAPLADKVDANGYVSFNGNFLCHAHPDSLDDIRDFDPLVDDVLEDESPPLRNRLKIRKVALKAGLNRTQYIEWTSALKDYSNSLFGLSVIQGQIDYYSNKVNRLSLSLKEKREYLKDKLKSDMDHIKQDMDYSLDIILAWAQGSPNKYYKKLGHKLPLISASLETAKQYESRHWDTYNKHNKKYEKALEVLNKYESENKHFILSV